MPEITFRIKNKVGLHGPSSSVFVREATKYNLPLLSLW
jgi:phosphotransferase system HPr-like phosphotransfer protein